MKEKIITEQLADIGGTYTRRQSRKLEKIAQDLRETAFCWRRNCLNPKYNGGVDPDDALAANPQQVEAWKALDAVATALDGKRAI